MLVLNEDEVQRLVVLAWMHTEISKRVRLYVLVAVKFLKACQFNIARSIITKAV